MPGFLAVRQGQDRHEPTSALMSTMLPGIYLTTGNHSAPKASIYWNVNPTTSFLIGGGPLFLDSSQIDPSQVLRNTAGSLCLSHADR